MKLSAYVANFKNEEKHTDLLIINKLYNSNYRYL